MLKAVDDVTIDIKKGEIYLLLENLDQGKTTFGRTLARLYDKNLWNSLH